MKRSIVGLAVSVLLAGGSVFVATSAGATTAKGAARTPTVLTCAGKTVVKPSSYVLTCADANTYFKSINWSSWGAHSATGTATLVENTCEPSCVAGKFVNYAVQLQLSDPTQTSLGMLFGNVSYTYIVSSSFSLPLKKLS